MIDFFAKKINAVIAVFERVPAWMFQFMMRVAAGEAFWSSGMVKIKSWESTLALFRDEYKVPLLPPEFAAYMATTCELTMPVLLLFGFGTRFAALAMLGQTAVIQIFVYPANWPDHILWASILGFLIVRGAGTLSLDELVARKWGKPRAV